MEHEHNATSTWSASTLLTPPVCAVVAFTLAVTALLGQNGLTVGFASVLESGIGLGGGAFHLSWGLATAVQVVLVLLLARRTFDGPGPWVATLGRASVVIAGVALLAAVFVVLGGVFNDVFGY